MSVEECAMSHTVANYHDVESDVDSMYFLRDVLNCENIGVTVVDCGPGWTNTEHNHSDDQQEEVYLLIEGQATVTVEDDVIEMEAGDAVRISPDETHQIENGDTDSRFVLIGAS